MHDQRGHVDAGQVLPEIRDPGWRAIESAFRRRNGCDIPAVRDDLLTDSVPQEGVEVVESLEEGRQVRKPVLRDGILDSAYGVLVKPAWIVRRFQKIGRDARHDGCLCDTARSVPSDVAGYLAAAHRKAGDRDVAQIELGDHLVEVFSKRAIVVAGGGLARLPKPPFGRK